MNANDTSLFELSSQQTELVSGGAIPLVAIAAAFGSGALKGFSVAALAHGTYKAYKFVTQ